MNNNIDKPNFYEQLDIVFEKLYTKFGLSKDIIQLKEDLLYVYENENQWRCDDLLRAIKPKKWYVDSNGYVQLHNTT
jgi:hypothetical protein